MLHWGFFAALIGLCLVFDAWVYKVARKRGYKEGARDYAPRHHLHTFSDTVHCTHCDFSFDVNDEPSADKIPPCTSAYVTRKTNSGAFQ